MSKCIQFAAEMHDYTKTTKTWQTVDYAKYQILQHSKEILVCSKCGHVIDPWPKTKGEPQ